MSNVIHANPNGYRGSTESALLVQIKQSAWRLDHDPPRAGVYDRADFTRERNLNFMLARRHDQSAGVHQAFHVGDEANSLAAAGFNVTSDQLVAVERTGGQANQTLSRDSQLEANQCFRGVHRVDAKNEHDRPPLVKTHLIERQTLDLPATVHEQFGAPPEPFLGEISLYVHDHLTSNTVRSGDPADDRHFLPQHHEDPNLRI